MKSRCTYYSPLWSKAAIISSQVLRVLSFPPWSASFHSHQLHQIIWNITPAAAAQEVPDEAVRFPFEGRIIKETQRGEKSFVFCCAWSFESSLMWFILPPVSPSSLAIPSNTWAVLHTRDKMCFHGNRPVMPLLVCQMKSTSAERNQLVTRLISHQDDGMTSESRAVLGLCERRPSLFHTRTYHSLLRSFYFFFSPMASLELYLLPSLLWLIPYKHTTRLGLMTAQILMP